ncbi:hypothetical protein [Stenotrophomonas sp. CFBP 13718]|uniref:hypothetical protein n=1 Tax=Stenotrophomonas sp. CFBP 13718 TaxID=2775304 RepID=UPI001781AC87|nr:hypothetical protein [Stenotrophomonas sp. CFBP 13718]MBD8696201.1 hypothetical protein [Stenotrophomonas sp. CFBP 13718]
MEKQQAEAVSSALFAPELQAQQQRSAQLAVAAARREGQRQRGAFALAGVLVGGPLAWVTGASIGYGALLGMAAGCALHAASSFARR